MENIEQFYEIIQHKIIDDCPEPDLFLESSENLKEFSCCFCHKIDSVPKQCGNCESIFCRGCLKAFLQNIDSKCSTCSKKFKEKAVPTAIKNIICKLKVNCPNYKIGCNRIFCLESLSDHVKICKFTKTYAKCFGCLEIMITTNNHYEIKEHVLMCEEIEEECRFCGERVVRNFLPHHEKFDCPFFPIKCDICSDRMEKNQYIKHLEKKCLKSNFKLINSFVEQKVSAVRREMKEKIKDKNKTIFDLVSKSKNKSHKFNYSKTFYLNTGVLCLAQLKSKSTPDTIMSGHSDHTIQIRDINSGNRSKILKGHTGPVISLIYAKSTHETFIISGSTDKTIKIWNPNTAACLYTLADHTAIIYGLIQMKNSEESITLVSGSGDNTIKIWDLDNMVCVKTLTGHTGPVLCLIQMKWIKNKTTIVSGSFDNSIKVWNTNSGSCLLTLSGHTGPVNCLTQMNWKTDECTILSGSNDGKIRIWNVESKACVGILNGHTDFVKSLIQMKWLNDETTVISGGCDSTMKIWNVEARSCLATIPAHTKCLNSILQMKWEDDETTILSGSWDHTIKLWK